MFHVESREGGVSVLRLDDGKVNAMGPAFVDEFPKAFARAGQGGHAVVLAGNAKAFSAGLDLKTLPALEPHELVAFTHGFMRAFREVLAYERPVVAAVDGPAMAGGAILALASDFRLVTERARLGVTEVPVGIPFPAPVLRLVQARLPAQEHAPAILRGSVREGAACVETGWAHGIRAGSTLLDDAVTLAHELGGMSPIAFGLAKREQNRPLVEEFDRFDKHGAKAWADLLHAPETVEALLRTLARIGKR